MSETGLIKKLRLAAGQKALVLNAPAGYLQSLGELPAGITLSTQAEGTFDFVQLFVKDQAELERFGPGAFQAVKYDGLFWLCYPKQTGKIKSDLNRDILWKLVEPSGFSPVMQIAIDETWSALRFRPTEKVGNQ
ncbi:MAG: hypothetical protein A2W35_18790 [Chloroflexi bacterium RBG_16_57_11]|nr:MAG: hypothetical protein A2W35_18790 [Chloroflexi bacterium RBG_16_57_11]